MKLAILILFSLYSALAVADIDPVCQAWFTQGGLDSTSSDCEIKCATLPYDMSTFYCNTECEDLCRNHCGHPDSFWLSKLKDGRPPNWQHASEKLRPWSKTERSLVLDAMKRFPDSLWPKDPITIYRMQRSIDGDVPASSLQGTGEIAIYDTAFGRLPGTYIGQVLAHELAHQIYFKMSDKEKRDYDSSAGWNPKLHVWNSGTQFMREAAKENPEENFAVNVEDLLFETKNEQKTIPSTFDWLTGKFGKTFKLDEPCHEK